MSCDTAGESFPSKYQQIKWIVSLQFILTALSESLGALSTNDNVCMQRSKVANRFLGRKRLKTKGKTGARRPLDCGLG
jgi:hypothetical protein